MNSKDEALRQQIAHVEKELSDLESRRNETAKRAQILRDQLAAITARSDSGLSSNLESKVPETAREKIALFRKLFRGRKDVYPKLWTNAKSGKRGYSPACGNEWVRGICGKPKVKCGDCQNQAFSELTDQVILDHLQGRHVVGVYPLLEDDTCWFLAADFDKSSWQDDVCAFCQTCRKLKIPFAVERSRSGNGAHVWFFFNSPVQAAVARRMGCYLITETMSQHHQLSMESYDRFFPNQDTLPRGGFGNLIALPLQHGPRQEGNSVFVDESFHSLEDQWVFLATLPRINISDVESIARKAGNQGDSMGMRYIRTSDDWPDSAPWKRTSPDDKDRLKIDEPIPKVVKAMLAQQIFVEKTGLPSPLLNQIKRLAAFQNPEFYKKQSMRLSTALTPRVISCAEEFPEHIALPRGCRGELETLLRGHGVQLSIDDRRCNGERLNTSFHGDLTAIQEQAITELLKYDSGVFVAPPGIGKTVVGIRLIAERKTSTLILVHRQPLLDQWITQLALFLDIEEKEIGRIGGGKHKPNKKIDVAMFQSLIRKENVDELVAAYGHVIVDECHHLPAISFERVLKEVKARFITGLTATLQRRDGHHPIIEMQLGPIRFAVDARNQSAERPFAHVLIKRCTSFSLQGDSANPRIQELYSQLVLDDRRNEMICDDMLNALEEGRSPILLTERKDHLDYFAERLSKFAKNVVVLRGGKGVKARREMLDHLKSIPDEAERLILATGRYIGEGFDDSRLDTLFLALPVSWKGTLVQYAGRLHRLHPGKEEVQIYDYVDESVPMLARMFERRSRGYRAMGYRIEESGLETFNAAQSKL